MKTFYIFLGVQGAGKSTIFKHANKNEDFGERINQDVFVKKYSLNSSLLKDVVYVSSLVYDRLKVCSCGENNFNYETTIASTVLFKFIKLAKQNGFNVKVCWVYLNTIADHLKRIEHRVKNGGHNVHIPFVEANFKNRFKNASQLIKLCDEVNFFDNTSTFKLTAKFVDGNCVYKSDNVLPFENELKNSYCKQ